MYFVLCSFSTHIHSCMGHHNQDTDHLRHIQCSLLFFHNHIYFPPAYLPPQQCALLILPLPTLGPSNLRTVFHFSNFLFSGILYKCSMNKQHIIFWDCLFFTQRNSQLLPASMICFAFVVCQVVLRGIDLPQFDLTFPCWRTARLIPVFDLHE